MKNPEDHDQLVRLMQMLKLEDGLYLAGLVSKGPGSHELQVYLGDLDNALSVLCRKGILDMHMKKTLLSCAEETMSNAYSTYFDG